MLDNLPFKMGDVTNDKAMNDPKLPDFHTRAAKTIDKILHRAPQINNGPGSTILVFRVRINENESYISYSTLTH